jgi:hypothetical protein
MSITELTELGLPRDYLYQLSGARGAPVIRTIGKGKILFKTTELDEFMKEVTERERKQKATRRYERRM